MVLWRTIMQLIKEQGWQTLPEQAQQ